jgi:eukaryotic-like serine/threonine-protein kinase
VNQPRNSPDDRLLGQIIADRYHILSPLGEGGMGRVYLAEHVRMGRKSAVKVMSPNMALSVDAIARFNREAANASRINHPNVAQIYDFGETTDGMLYLAMEYVEGETLRHLIERVGPLPVVRAAELNRQIADALGAAHHLGIVHRDLKPDNILLTRTHDGSDQVKVVDFGIAKTVQGSGGEQVEVGSQTVTTAGVSLGTPEYMSPEQLAGERLDNRTDLFSLGLVLFNMLTANLPYPRITSKETLVRRLTAKPMSLSEIVPGTVWPAGLQQALDRALAPEPADRYASVVDFGRDVMSAANATVTLPARPGMARPLQEPTQRISEPNPRTPTRPLEAKSNRTALIAAGLVILLGAGSAGAYLATRSDVAADTTQPAAPAPTLAAAPVDSAKAPVVPPPAVVTKSSAARDTTPRVANPPAPKTAPKDSAPTTSTPLATDSSTSKTAPKDSAPTTSTPLATDSSTSKTLNRPRRAFQPEFRALAEQANEHFRKALDLVRTGDVAGTRGEFTKAAPIVAELRKLSAGTPSAAQVEQVVRGSSMQVVKACRDAMADTATRRKFPINFRCELVLPPGLRPQRGMRGNPAPLMDR